MANTTNLNLVKPDYTDDADIEDINDNSDKIDAFAGNTIANIGGTDFSTSSTYAVGAIVKHEGKLYRCATAVTTAGAWAAANWAEVSLQDEIDTVNVHNDRQNGTKLTTSSKYNVAGVEINNDTTPTSAKPNVGIDFRANDMRFYRDEGSGWVVKGDIPYNISDQISSLVTKGSDDKAASLGTAWTYTGMSVTIPAKKAFGINAWQTYNAAAPAGIAFNATSNSSFRDFESTIFNGCGVGSITGYNSGNSATTYYIWAKAGASGNNQCHLTYWYM